MKKHKEFIYKVQNYGDDCDLFISSDCEPEDIKASEVPQNLMSYQELCDYALAHKEDIKHNSISIIAYQSVNGNDDVTVIGYEIA